MTEALLAKFESLEVERKPLGVWLFVASDAMTFAALLAGYLYLRAGSDWWPRPFSFVPSIVLATVMTACLLTSSATMSRAVAAARSHGPAAARRWIGWTILFGAAFLLMHAAEWRHLLAEGLTTFTVPAPWVPAGASTASNFGAAFFTITGMHMLHVVAGVGCLAGLFAPRWAKAENIAACAVYWHFVDAVWLFVFALLYLLSIK